MGTKIRHLIDALIAVGVIDNEFFIDKIFCNTGSEKATVFPEPVLARTCVRTIINFTENQMRKHD